MLNNKCPAKFIGHITARQREQSREYGNHPSMKANSINVQKAMNKEEKNKFVMVLLFVARALHTQFALNTSRNLD